MITLEHVKQAIEAEAKLEVISVITSKVLGTAEQLVV